MRVLMLVFLAATALRAAPKWIWVVNEGTAPKNRFTYFRKAIDLKAVPAEATVLFAADSNAQLWVNGQPLRRKVTRYHEEAITAEVVDAAPALRAGKNIFVVLHHNWGPVTTFQRNANKHAGLWIGGAVVESDESWRAMRAPEFVQHEKQIRGVDSGQAWRIRYPVIVDGRSALAGGIHRPDFDDTSWPRAIAIGDGPWPGTPKPAETPGQHEYAVYPPAVVAAGRLEPGQPLSDEPLSIAVGIRRARYLPEESLLTQARLQLQGQPSSIKAGAGESRYITFDFEQPVHGFPFVELDGAPPGVTIDFGYGEVSYSQYSGERHVRPDGWLNPEAVVGIGYADRYVTRPGSQRIELPDERTARWLTIHFHFASGGEVVLKRAGIVRSQYPVLPAGTFFCGDERVDQIVKLCQIHAVVTMVDGYVDTPGREDGQWIEDARVRAIIGSRWFGDERLRRQVIRHHAESSRGNGGFHAFPPSNYPAYPANYDWAVQWSAMLYDDYLWSGKTDLIERYWNLLSQFWEGALSHVDENGIWRTNRVFADIRVGVHPGGPRQSSGIVTPFMIERLRWSAELAHAGGHRAEAERWTEAARRMSAAFRKFHVVASTADTPAHIGDRLDPENPAAGRGFSQSAQVNAILAGLLTGEESRSVLEFVFPTPDGSPPRGVTRWNNPTFAYRSLRALSDNGMTARAVAHLLERYSPYQPGNPRNRVDRRLQGPIGGPLPEYWISREDLHLKDGETNTAQPRDETGSHGWGAVPLLWMHDSLLGVRIVEPGGGRLRIAPDDGGLPYINGQTRTPKGPVRVHWRPREQKLEVEIPSGASAELILPPSLRHAGLVPAAAAKQIETRKYLLPSGGRYVFKHESSALVQPVPDASKAWCLNTDIAAADSSYIMNAPQVHLLESGDLVGIFPMDRYVSDAVHRGVRYGWYRSKEGVAWQALASPPPGFAQLGPMKMPVRGLKLTNGSLLATATWGWENFPQTERAKLSSQGYYLFDSAAGNAPGVVSVIRRVLVSRSTDGGQTWQTGDAQLPFVPHLALYGNAIVLRSGEYLQPAWGRFDLKKEPKWVSSLVLRTEDGGRRWEVATVAKARDFDFNETSIAEAANGDVVAVIRTTAQKELWTAYSVDRGKTWSAPKDSGMRGSTPWLVRAASGELVAVYIRRERTLFPSTGVFACASRDSGRTWDVEHEAMLRDSGATRVDGYPQAAPLPDGSIFAVYVLEISMPQRGGGQITSAPKRTLVGGTRFTPSYAGPPIAHYDK